MDYKVGDIVEEDGRKYEILRVVLPENLEEPKVLGLVVRALETDALTQTQHREAR